MSFLVVFILNMRTLKCRRINIEYLRIMSILNFAFLKNSTFYNTSITGKIMNIIEFQAKIEEDEDGRSIVASLLIDGKPLEVLA